MRKLIIAMAGLAAVMIPAASASAQGRYGGGYGYNNGGYSQGLSRECRRALRHADNRWEYRRALRQCRHESSRYERRDRWDDRGGYRDDRRGGGNRGRRGW
jgi:hypothetical protein